MYAIVDIETTGGRPYIHQITEIAIFLHNGHHITDSFETLINPQVPIPPYITGITGITNDMVAQAPTFEDVALKIQNFTEGKVFVAHHVSFDYSFLQAQFESIGMKFERLRLCTLRLSRKIFPGLRKYNLGALCEQLSIPLQNRHRAGGDAHATALLFSQLIQQDTQQEIAKQLKYSSTALHLPPAISDDLIRQLPETTGIYYFHNAQSTVIYVGKVNNIKARVKQHFTKGSETWQNPLMVSQIEDISYQETGNELIALLKECEEIKRLFPLYNRALKRQELGYGVYRYQDQNQYERLAINKINKQNKPIFRFHTDGEARAFIAKLSRQHQLCLKLLGLHTAPTACYDYGQGNCLGACCGKETPISFNQRFQNALNEQEQAQKGSFLIKGKGRYDDEVAWVWIHNGIYKGYCFTDKYSDIASAEDITQLIKHREHTPDIERILVYFLQHRFQGFTIIKLLDA